MQDRWDRFIWLIVMLPLLVFFLMTVLISFTSSSLPLGEV